MFDEKRFTDIADAFFRKDGMPACDDKATGTLLIVPSEIKTAVLLSAPHAVEHLRDGKPKFAEPDTAALAIMLGEELGCPVIINVFGKEDPNYHEESPYCDRAVSAIKEHGLKLALDMHESAPNRAYSFAVGTGYGKNVFGKIEIAEAFARALVEHGFDNVEVDLYPYAGSKERTVASSLRREARVPAIQLEINSKFFMEGKDRDPKRVYEALFTAVCAALMTADIVSGIPSKTSAQSGS